MDSASSLPSAVSRFGRRAMGKDAAVFVGDMRM